MIPILLVLGAFMSMEAVAWFSHRFIMHGLLWNLHRDHHQKKPEGFFERNDFFFLLFSIPGMILIYLGTTYCTTCLWLGIGISMYGAAYFLVHDVFIHQRVRLFTRSNNFYLRAIRRAHKMHHRHLDRFHGECFGMLWAPLKYFREALKSNG